MYLTRIDELDEEASSELGGLVPKTVAEDAR
jgi:hypothetical protein